MPAATGRRPGSSSRAPTRSTATAGSARAGPAISSSATGTWRSRRRIKELLARRIATQPLNLPNAGSVFRNPPGDHAARLVEACGLKGFAVGGARISELHANFIVNPDGQAKAADIEAIIGHAQRAVRARFGIELVPEVRIIGEAV